MRGWREPGGSKSGRYGVCTPYTRISGPSLVSLTLSLLWTSSLWTSSPLTITFPLLWSSYLPSPLVYSGLPPSLQTPFFELCSMLKSRSFETRKLLLWLNLSSRVSPLVQLSGYTQEQYTSEGNYRNPSNTNVWCIACLSPNAGLFGRPSVHNAFFSTSSFE